MASSMYCLVSIFLLASQLYGMEAVVTKASNAKFSSLSSEDKAEVHIVYLGGTRATTTTDLHLGILSETLGSEQGAADSILYSYKKSFNGFAAVFTESHAQKIRGLDGVVSVFKSQTKQLHTTASWEYLGLNPTEGAWPKANFGNGTIVGLLDTGVWPESLSFNDDGFGPIPAKWKGSCVEGENFTLANCNNKLIGAKFYNKGYIAQYGPIKPPEYDSPRDHAGHGSHTSSTAAGRQVPDASLDGVANGTASGGVPLARIAMYKVCWFESCTEADMLAAFEDAISDGVDILSLSIGGPAVEYYLDSVAIGAFHAVQSGILVSCSAGNGGPAPGSVLNGAPWIFTVAASTIDRVYQSSIELVNSNVSIPGIAINTYTLNSSYPLVYGADIAKNGTTPGEAAFCDSASLDPNKTFGKLVVCKGGFEDVARGLKRLGSVGFVEISKADQSVLFTEILSTTTVDPEQGDVILEFVNSTTNPTAIINPATTVFNTTPAPILAFFSSRGPNTITHNLLKPDISAPGVDILAAWSPSSSSSGDPGDDRFPNYNIISGTSMSCPHVAGLAALVKSVHPEWTPGAIKSAIMTTATSFNDSIPANIGLGIGAGQINPSRAVDPGLVFNVTRIDYVNFLCASGFNSTAVDLITGGTDECTQSQTTVLDLNYPSIYVSTNVTVGFVHNTTRTLTNVGPDSNVTYVATVTPPTGVDVKVAPSSLSFSAINEEQSFSVSINATTYINGSSFGSIVWNENGGSSSVAHSVKVVLGVGPLSTFRSDPT